MKILVWILCIIYVLSPIDLFPGPIDDAIVTVAAFGLTSLFGGGSNSNGNRNQNKIN